MWNIFILRRYLISLKWQVESSCGSWSTSLLWLSWSSSCRVHLCNQRRRRRSYELMSCLSWSQPSQNKNTKTEGEKKKKRSLKSFPCSCFPSWLHFTPDFLFLCCGCVCVVVHVCVCILLASFPFFLLLNQHSWKSPCTDLPVPEQCEETPSPGVSTAPHSTFICLFCTFESTDKVGTFRLRDQLCVYFFMDKFTVELCALSYWSAGIIWKWTKSTTGC